MDKSDKPPMSDREARLAEALRANLRRRKTGKRPSPKPPSDTAET
jgi:hypothetical protein